MEKAVLKVETFDSLKKENEFLIETLRDIGDLSVRKWLDVGFNHGKLSIKEYERYAEEIAHKVKNALLNVSKLD